MASGTGFPCPSYTTPAIRSAPGVSAGTTSGCGGRSRPNSKKGPTVWEGVGRSRSATLLSFHRRGVPSAQDNVEPVAERPLGPGEGEIEGADESFASAGIADRLEDGIVLEEWISREVHLRHQPRREGRAKHGEVDVGRPPGIGVVSPWVRARLDGDELVAALVVGEAASRPTEVGVQRCRVLIDGVGIA